MRGSLFAILQPLGMTRSRISCGDVKFIIINGRVRILIGLYAPHFTKMVALSLPSHTLI